MSHTVRELQEHLPYTIFCTSLGIILLGLLSFINPGAEIECYHDLYHIFHPLHLLFSATATASMFWMYEKKILKTIIVGTVGSLGICGISDVVIPYAASYLLGVTPHFHLCIVEHPMHILPFLLVGLFVAFLSLPNKYFSHIGHVLISSAASILYLVSYGLVEWQHSIGMVFVYIILAVVIPCCTSDVIFPLLSTEKRKHVH